MLTTPRKQFNTINEYVRIFPKDVRDILEEIRQTIQRAAPDAEETISYQIPAFKLNGKTLVYFAAFKKHIGFYPPAPKAFKKDVAPYAGPKGNLKFPLDKPVPYDLMRKIVEFRVKEIEGKKE